jgi:pimeloyl-ACP methyl ester carboxylesterase
MAKDDANCGELRDLLGDAAYGEYRKLAVKLDTAHLGFRAPKNLVFLPGVMGSLLESKTRGGLWWIDVRTRDRIDHLKLSADGKDDAEPKNEIVPVTSDPSYDPFLTAVLDEPGFGHEIFVYDWRKSLRHSARALLELVDRLHSENGGVPVHIVAHSMGGLMVRAALMQHAEALWPLLGKIIFIGTPHYGSPAIAGYLKNHLWGFELMAILGQYLSRETFRSLWGLIGMLPAPCGIYPGTRPSDPSPWRSENPGDPYVHPCSNFDMYRADDWKLGLATDETTQLQRILGDAVEFHHGMFETHRKLSQDQRARMTVIAGVGYQTLFRLAYEPGFLGLWEHTAKITERVEGDRHREGDGRVPLASAALDDVEIRYVKGEHGGLPNIPSVYQDVFRCLRGEPMKLATQPYEALGNHLAVGAESEAPHLDGTSKSVPFTDDPGYWKRNPAPREELDELNRLLVDEKLPEFARVRLL